MFPGEIVRRRVMKDELLSGTKFLLLYSRLYCTYVPCSFPTSSDYQWYLVSFNRRAHNDNSELLFSLFVSHIIFRVENEPLRTTRERIIAMGASYKVHSNWTNSTTGRLLASLAVFILLGSINPSESFMPAHSSSFCRSGGSYSRTMTLSATNSPFGVIVQAEIEPDRMAEFLSLIENNAKQSRKEKGCLRFDVLRCQESPNQFFFYEVYNNEDAVTEHKTTDHYKSWATFKESGGVISSTSYKVDGEFMT